MIKRWQEGQLAKRGVMRDGKVVKEEEEMKGGRGVVECLWMKIKLKVLPSQTL